LIDQSYVSISICSIIKKRLSFVFYRFDKDYINDAAREKLHSILFWAGI
jgi:hypothetical protein